MMAAAPSAMGPAYMTPSMPIKSGKMTMSGSRNKIWRVRDMNTPRRALPIELKKLEVTGWMPLISVRNI